MSENIENTQLKNFKTLADRAFSEKNYSMAERYYSSVLELDPNDGDATFKVVYSNSMQCVIANIESACNRVSNVIPTAFSLLRQRADNGPFDLTIADLNMSTISTLSIIMAYDMITAANNHYNGIDSSIQSNYRGEKNSRCRAAANIVCTCWTCINSLDAERFHRTHEALGRLANAYLKNFKRYTGDAYAKDILIKWAEIAPNDAVEYIKSEIHNQSDSLKNAYLDVWKSLDPDAEYEFSIKTKEIELYHKRIKTGGKAFSVTLGFGIIISSFFVDYKDALGSFWGNFLIIASAVIGICGVIAFIERAVTMKRLTAELEDMKAEFEEHKNKEKNKEQTVKSTV